MVTTAQFTFAGACRLRIARASRELRGVRGAALRVSFCVALYAVVVVFTLTAGDVRAAESASGASSAAVKAAFLIRFGAFVRWPDGAPSSLVIAVVDDDGEIADALTRLGTARRVVVHRIDRPDQIGDARIVFIGRSRTPVLRRWAAVLAERGVLIVSDEAASLTDGQVINFVMREQRVRFEISMQAADTAGLKLDSGLLNVATRVEGAAPGARTGCAVDTPCNAPRRLAGSAGRRRGLLA